MSEPLLFRIVFGALFLLLFGVVTTYRVKAQSGRKIDYSKEGGAVFLALRLGGLSIWLYCLLYVVYPLVLTWSFIELPSVVRWAGVGLVLLLIPFIVSAQRALGRNVSPTVMTHADHEAGDRRAVPLDPQPAVHRGGHAVHRAGVDLG